MEILDLRHLRSRDLEPLLEEERSLWQKDLQWDYSSSAALIRRYLDARALPGYAAVEAGRTVGYGFYVYEHAKGVVGDVFVTDSDHAQATETELLTHVVETLQATPGIQRIEAQLMNLRHHPSCDFFFRESLQSFRRRFMILRLQDSLVPEPVTTKAELLSWEPRWANDAAQLIARAYRGHVDSAISDQYRSRSGAMRFLDNIVHYPGCGEFDPECSFVAVQRGMPGIRGLVLCSIVGNRVSHITQVCVDPELQGTGIGTMLIGRIVRALRDRRFSAVTLTVTDSNSRAVRLYEQLRFSTLKEFYAFAWDAAQNGHESHILGRS